MSAGAPGDDDAPAGPIGLRGPGGLPPRWRHVEEIFAELTSAQAAGGATASEPAARRILEETLVDDVDAVGLDIRARALSNLAAVAEARGDLAESIALAGRAIETCLVAEAELGAARRTVDVRVGCLINRAQTLALVGRDADGLADLAAAEAALDPDSPPLLVFSLRNTRGNALLAVERLEEAQTEFERALDAALAHEPRLASYAYSGLAAVAHRTGDRDLAAEHLLLSRELQATDEASAARADENLARLLLERGDVDGAEARLAAAEQGYERGGDPRRAAGCRYARAAAHFARGRLDAALRLGRRALDDLAAQGDVAAQIETCLLLADVHAHELRHAEADAMCLRARALSEAQGAATHELARIDARRAGIAEAAAELAVDPAERGRLLEVALNLALPAALATDAMRARFAPGPVRERWVAQVAGASLSSAFRIVAALRQTRLAVELVEFVCSSASASASASADADAEAAVEAGRTGSLVDGEPAPWARSGEEELSSVRSPFALAASGAPGPTGTTHADADAGALDAATGRAASADAAGGLIRSDAPASADPPRILPALPPRVRAFPDGSREFHAWIDEAERRYRLGIRSTEVIDAW